METVLVVEEGYPLIERGLKGLFGIPGKTVRGKLSGRPAADGRTVARIVRPALGLAPLPAAGLGEFKPAGRPPQLCVGCPHADTFKALNKALEGTTRVQRLSATSAATRWAPFPPYNAVHTCVCMGASVGMAKGGAEAGVHPSVAVIGDSTFGHSGMTPLLSAAAADTNMTVFILDNCTVAMTGGQPSFASGERLLRMIEGLGVPKEHIRVIEPLPKNLEKNVRDHQGGDRPPGPLGHRRRPGMPRGSPEEKKELSSMKQDIILAGVGGQGILSIAFVIDSAALEEGLSSSRPRSTAWPSGAARSSPTSGCPADRIWSDLIPRGEADLILSVEPLEALRYLDYLRPDGMVITSSTPFVNIPDYPPIETRPGRDPEGPRQRHRRFGEAGQGSRDRPRPRTRSCSARRRST